LCTCDSRREGEAEIRTTKEGGKKRRKLKKKGSKLKIGELMGGKKGRFVGKENDSGGDAEKTTGEEWGKQRRVGGKGGTISKTTRGGRKERGNLRTPWRWNSGVTLTRVFNQKRGKNNKIKNHKGRRQEQRAGQGCTEGGGGLELTRPRRPGKVRQKAKRKKDAQIA